MGQRIKIINIKPKKAKRIKRKITITRLKQRAVKKLPVSTFHTMNIKDSWSVARLQMMKKLSLKCAEKRKALQTLLWL